MPQHGIRYPFHRALKNKLMLLAGLSILSFNSAMAANGYRVVELPWSLDNPGSFPYIVPSGIADNGTIVGNLGGITSKAGVWKDGVFTTYSTNASLYAVNLAGQAVGSELVNNNPVAVSYTAPGVRAFIPTINTYGASAVGINDAGDIISYGVDGVGNNVGYLTKGGVTSRMTPPSNYPANAPVGVSAINNLGQIVGNLTSREAYVWKNGVYQVIPAGNNIGPISATDINDAGQVVGVDLGSSYDIYIWKDGMKAKLGVQAASTYDSIKINNAGVIIGQNFVFKNGVRIAANDLLPPAAPGVTWYGVWLTGLNNAGQIVGWGMRTSTKYSSGLESVPLLFTPETLCGY